MNRNKFAEIRLNLGKTQNQLAQLLGVSAKAVQSFEQGWRKIPTHVERQILFLYHLKNQPARQVENCWDVIQCLPEQREKCPAWELQAGQLCWFINGTLCEGRTYRNWSSKMEHCRGCKVLGTFFPVQPQK